MPPTTMGSEKVSIQNSRMRPAQALLIAFELALALWVIALVHLEPSARISAHEGSGVSFLFALVPLFLIYVMIPLRLRLPLMVLSTFALILFLCGVTAGATIIVAGLTLIGICHLPIAYPWRLVMILAVVGVLAAMMAQLIQPGRHLEIALPVLGAIFMFRLIIYLYDIRHEKPGSATIWQRIGYFFLLPAPLFPFFPTLDYRTYLRSYYSRPAFETAQVGMLWIARGVVHLVLYRVIYHFYSPPAEHVVDLGGVMAYCLSGYLIYLRVSGLFHLITGCLRLFGFELPETHRLYFFASGFSDYWRRINIYWKDFMAKIFFFPSYAALRRTGFNNAGKVAIATVIVFAATTVLHSYQAFWLGGGFVIHETDYWFWGILGVLVLIDNYLAEKRKKKLPSRKWNTAAAAWLSLRTAAMFVFLCVLWSLWSSHQLSVWFGVMRQSFNAQPWHLAVLVGFFVASVGLGTLGQYIKHRGFDLFAERPGLARSIASTIIPMLLLGCLWQYHAKVGLRGEFGETIEIIGSDEPNLRDQIQKERSYYEGLLSNDGGGGDREGTLKEDVPGDIRELRYRPGLKRDGIFGASWSSNRWGMHDKYYSKRKRDGVYRIAVSGASYTLGRGVDDGMNFESVLEEHLNGPDAKEPWIEILNFAQADTCTLQRMAKLEFEMVDFRPDAFYIFCHPGEEDRNVRKLGDLISAGHELTYPYLKELVAELGLQAGDPRADVIRALQPYSEDLMRFAYQHMAEICRERDIEPVWVFLPLVRTKRVMEAAEVNAPIVREAGFTTLVLDDAYGGLDPDEIKISQNDYHPNNVGHRHIVKRLLERMKEEREELGLPPQIDSAAPFEP
ncbi:MAG: hypothetical protein ACR2RV_09100 [Verrucomicrobiales bacterium]